MPAPARDLARDLATLALALRAEGRIADGLAAPGLAAIARTLADAVTSGDPLATRCAVDAVPHLADATEARWARVYGGTTSPHVAGRLRTWGRATADALSLADAVTLARGDGDPHAARLAATPSSDLTGLGLRLAGRLARRRSRPGDAMIDAVSGDAIGEGDAVS